MNNFIKRVIRCVKREGGGAALAKVPSFLFSRFNPAIKRQEKEFALRAEEFDRINNVDTAGRIYQTELWTNNKNQLYAVYYQGSDAQRFDDAVSSLEIDHDEFTFIDFGSGKGKVLFLASAYPFKEIVGIEFSEELAAIAKKNMRSIDKDNIVTCRMDVVDYPIPDEPLVCYFYDPFDDHVLTKVLSNLRKAWYLHRKKMIILYNEPRFFALFEAEEWLVRTGSVGPVVIWSSKE